MKRNPDCISTTLLVRSLIVVALFGCDPQPPQPQSPPGTAPASAPIAAPMPVAIALSPPSARIAQGTGQTFTVKATFADGHTQDVSEAASFSIVNEQGRSQPATTPLPALVTVEEPGHFRLRVTLSGQAIDAPLDVTDATLTSVAISPLLPTIAVGTSQQFTLTGKFSDGTTQDVSSLSAWSVKNVMGTGVAVISSLGLCTANAVGKATISGRYKTKSASTTLQVTAAVVSHLLVAPEIASIMKGASLQFSATAVFTDGSSQDVTALSAWSVQDITGVGVAEIDGSGLALGLSVGQAAVSAEYDTFLTSTTLTVTGAPTVVSVSISPTTATIAEGGDQQFAAVATLSDGTTQNVSALSTWTVADVIGSGVATIDGAGLAAGVHAGQASVKVTYGALSAGAVLTVQPVGKWVQQLGSGVNYLEGIWGTDVNHIWTVGQSGTILYWDGKTWTAQISGSTEFLVGIWGTSTKSIWATGTNGTILHFDGTTWSKQTTGTTVELDGIWGSSASNIWVVGDAGTTLRFNGTAWTAVSTGVTNHLIGCWGSAANSIWAVGDSGTILKWNGTAWSTKASGTSNWLGGVWGSSANNVWAVGDVGTILHWNGTAWAPQTSGLTNQLDRIWGFDANNIWAVGAQTILRWNGVAWVSQSTDPVIWPLGVWGTDPNNVWVAGDSSSIFRWVP